MGAGSRLGVQHLLRHVGGCTGPYDRRGSVETPGPAALREKLEMLGFLIFVDLILALAAVVLWLRFIRPTQVVWQRRSRLMAAVLLSVTAIGFLFVVATYAGTFG